jgi:hypothetical protein
MVSWDFLGREFSRICRDSIKEEKEKQPGYKNPGLL